MAERTREELVESIVQAGLVAIVRADRAQGLIEICSALVAGGLRAVEITMTTPGALEAIAGARAELGERCLVGVGSVRDAATAEQAIDAGAQFVVAPIFKQEVLDAAHAQGRPIIPGALTPNEMATAHEAGADLIKVFPANHFGPRYFKDVLAPMPDLKLTPTGGVTLDNVGEWFAAGAKCLGVGSALVRRELIASEDWAGLTELSRQFVDAVQAARS